MPVTNLSLPQDDCQCIFLTYCFYWLFLTFVNDQVTFSKKVFPKPRPCGCNAKLTGPEAQPHVSFPNEGRVSHISLVFREMWDTTDVYRKVHRMNESQTERVVAHPSFVRERKLAGAGISGVPT